MTCNITEPDLMLLGQVALIAKHHGLREALRQERYLPWDAAKAIAEEDLRVIRTLNDRFPGWNKP